MNCNKEDDGVDVFQCQDEVPNDVEATIVKTPYSPMVTCRIDGVELSGMCNVQMAKVFEKVCIDDLKGGDDKKLVTAKDLHAFLSGGQNGISDDIIGIFKQMGEVDALTASIEDKTKRIDDLGFSIVGHKKDLTDAKGSLLEEEKFLAEPQKECGLRSQELLALADVIKILNYDDHAYEHFHLKNKKLTYTVDDSNLDYSLTGALYFVHMDWDGDQSKYGNVDAELDIGYRHAQCPHDLKFVNGEANNEDWKPSEMDVNSISGKYGSCCTKIDLWEANKISTAYTVHLCDGGEQTRCSGTDCGDDGPGRFKGTCDKNGCDIQSSYLGNPKFFRLGPDLQVDSTKPITVTTQFITNDGTDTVEMKQFYIQNGKTIDHPEYSAQNDH